ncbi:hypothetical protein ACUODJ_60715, partial [Escherichia sp. HC-CC]
KLESIPGFDIFPDDNRFREIIKDVGVAIIGQTSSLAPADKRFYATRDITASRPSASFFARIEAVISGMESTVAV